MLDEIFPDGINGNNTMSDRITFSILSSYKKR